MKVDVIALALRLALAGFILSLIVLFLYLAGAAQSFLETTQSLLFRTVRWLSWLGALGSWLLLVPVARRNAVRLASSVALGLGFALLFVFVLLWGSWIYPEAGMLPW